MNKIKPVDSCGDELDQIPIAKVTAKPEPQNIQDQSNAQRFVLGQTVYFFKQDVADLPPGSKGKVNDILKNGRIIILYKNDSCISLWPEALESEESYLARLGYSADQVVYSKKTFEIVTSKGKVMINKGSKGTITGPASDSCNRQEYVHVSFMGNSVDCHFKQDVESIQSATYRLGFDSDDDSFIQRKIQEPNLTLDTMQQLQCLMSCVGLGQKQAFKATDKDIVIFVGNTGAGKSTIINYLHGCEFERVKGDQIQHLNNSVAPDDNGESPAKEIPVLVTKKKIYHVKPSSVREEIVRMGHTNQSMTYIPEIQTDENFVYCDCPGFLDNRGPEINIANAVNIKQTIYEARSVRVVIMLNYHTICTDRTQGIRDLARALEDLFGQGTGNIKQHCSSILLGISRSPLVHDDDDEDENEGGGAEGGGKKFTLDDAKAIFCEGCDGLPAPLREVPYLCEVYAFLLYLFIRFLIFFVLFRFPCFAYYYFAIYSEFSILT